MPERPPKKWLEKMVSRLKTQYKRRTKKDLTRIAAGIWHKKYTPAQKRRIAKKYERKRK